MAKDGEATRYSVRQISLRDHLWRTFELMSAEQEKPIAELVNDALAAYAQIAGYETTGTRDSSPGISQGVLPDPAQHRPAAPIPPMPGPGHAGPVPGTTGGGPGSGPAPGFVPGAGTGPGPGPGRLGRPPFGGPGGLPTGAPSAASALPPRAAPAPASMSMSAQVDGAGIAAAPVLYLVFDHQKYRIDKDQFIIGRGSKSSDLPIKDGNISRKHAAVIRRNGTFFIKDLGSTNGIDFKGMRIDNKRIDEGDVFHICEYELRFTYKR